MQSSPEKFDIAPNPVSAIVTAGLRYLISLHPHWAWLGQCWSEYETYRTGKRIEEFFQDFAVELEAVKLTVADLADRARDCEDFPELLEITIEKVRREFEEDKRAKYARVLARLVVNRAEHAHDRKVALIESLDSLSETDLRVLSLFSGKTIAAITDLGWRDLGLPGDANDQLWELASGLAKLESRGLILKASTHMGVVHVPMQGDPDVARWQETKYRLLPLGMSLIRVLFE